MPTNTWIAFLRGINVGLAGPPQKSGLPRLRARTCLEVRDLAADGGGR